MVVLSLIIMKKKKVSKKVSRPYKMSMIRIKSGYCILHTHKLHAHTSTFILRQKTLQRLSEYKCFR